MKSELLIQVMAMPRDTNPNGVIFGGWLMSMMDLASAVLGPKGRSATRAVNNIEFLKPVEVGDLVSCYGRVLKTGNSSVTVGIDVYTNNKSKVAHGDFTHVSLDETGKIRKTK